MVLPQGFRDSPHLFRQALARDLKDLNLEEGQLLQYVDDLLFCYPSKNRALQHAVQTLNLLADRGYKVSRAKVQLRKEVHYLGLILTLGEHKLFRERVQTIERLPPPSNRKQLRTFLGLTGYCRLWILGYGLLAKPLYEVLKGRADRDTLIWEPEQEKTFHELKLKLLQALTLGLPKMDRPFQLHTTEKNGIALGMLTQTLGPTKRPVAYLSKRLDSVALGWPSCLQAVAVTTLLVEEASKLTMAQPLEVYFSHQITSLLELKGPHTQAT